MSADNKKTKKWIKPVILLGAIILLAGLANVFGVGHRLGQLRNWIETLGYWGPIVWIFIYAVAVTALIPGSALTIAAGAMFGSVIGVVTVSIASTLGACFSFLIARYIARNSVDHWLKRQEKFRKLDELTEKHGAVIVAVTRLVPLFPYTLLNYGFGLTKIPFGTYIFWSWFCMLPGTVLYVAGADAVVRIAASGTLPWGLVGIIAIFFVILTMLVRHARSLLKEKETTKKTD